ncbi:MAG: nuclear transport factor 2 family protein [Pseudomonadota bacterium]
MRALIVLIITTAAAAYAQAPTGNADDASITQANKALARGFYDDLWFNDRTDRYEQYLAPNYVAHDIGDRKGVTEPAAEQKLIADQFWDNGDMSASSLDYQIAEGDLVATRWTWRYEPETLFGKLLFGSTDIPIINVFRVEDGKIVELWNHRHDIDTGMTKIFMAKGLGVGLLIALIPTLYAFRLRGKLRAALAAH